MTVGKAPRMTRCGDFLKENRHSAAIQPFTFQFFLAFDKRKNGNYNRGRSLKG